MDSRHDHQQKSPLGLLHDLWFASPGLPFWTEAAVKHGQVSPPLTGRHCRRPLFILPVPTAFSWFRPLSPVTWTPALAPQFLLSWSLPLPPSPGGSQYFPGNPPKPFRPQPPALPTRTERLSSHRPESGVGSSPLDKPACLALFHITSHLSFN